MVAEQDLARAGRARPAAYSVAARYSWVSGNGNDKQLVTLIPLVTGRRACACHL